MYLVDWSLAYYLFQENISQSLPSYSSQLYVKNNFAEAHVKNKTKVFKILNIFAKQIWVIGVGFWGLFFFAFTISLVLIQFEFCIFYLFYFCINIFPSSLTLFFKLLLFSLTILSKQMFRHYNSDFQKKFKNTWPLPTVLQCISTNKWWTSSDTSKLQD